MLLFLKNKKDGNDSMDYISTQEASEKWGISTTRITILAREGRIPGAQRFGKNWLIPVDAVKPPERKGGRGRLPKPELDHFSFPLYPYRPDWSEAKEKQLSAQQKRLLAAETAFLECRYEDAYPTLETILAAPEDICTEVGALWHAGMCCIALNRPEAFTKLFLRLQMLLAGDFPHRDDLEIVLDALKTYVETIGFSARKPLRLPDVHGQAVPWGCVLAGYTQLSKEAMKPGSADVTLLELNLRLLQTTSSVFAVEMLHLYLLAVYLFRQNTVKAEEHARAAVRLAYETKVYFPLVSYFHYHTGVLNPILEQYPEEFQALCHRLSAQYEKSFTAFVASIGEGSVLANLTDEDYPYVFAVLMEQSNTHLAKKLGISSATVRRRLDKLYEKCGVKDKKELKKYLRNHM